ncbi:MAG: hypothetical protein ABWX98_02580 [Lacisediminihabitans sp.]
MTDTDPTASAAAAGSTAAESTAVENTAVESTEPTAADQYHDGNERDIAAKQRRPEESAAFDDEEIDSAKVQVLPGTGGPDDVGATDAEPADYNRTGH